MKYTLKRFNEKNYFVNLLAISVLSAFKEQSKVCSVGLFRTILCKF